MSFYSVLTRPEQIQAVFKDSDKHSKAVNNNSGYLMSQVLGECVGLISGNEWKTVRTSMEQPFLRKTAVEYVPLIQRHVLKHFDELWKCSKLGEGLLDPAEDLKLLPFWVVAEIIYGELSPQMVLELKELAPLREDIFKDVIHGGLSRFPFSRYLPTKANASLARFRARWESFNDSAYRRAMSSRITAPIVHMHDAVEKGLMTTEQLLQTLDESLYANLDVTTGGISWNLVFLAAYKSYQASLLEESMGVSPENHVQYILSSSTLLAACISESSRLKPLAAFSVPQSAPTERIIDGYVIPPGTDFIVDSYGLNIRNEFWGTDSSVYRPERFLEKGSMEIRYHFWRFGFGPRQCMGKYVADFIIRILLVHLVTNYELGVLESSSEWGRDPETWINHPKLQLKCLRKSASRAKDRFGWTASELSKKPSHRPESVGESF